MKRVLIVTYHFPPVNNIAARRFGEMTAYMTNFGWEPYVLTTKGVGSLPVHLSEKNIIRVSEHYENQKRVVSEEGYRGIPSWLKFPYFIYRNSGIELKSLDRFMFTWGKEAKGELSRIREINPDIIIGSSDPAASIWAARFFAAKLKRPWIADLQDPLSFWNGSHFPLAKSLDEIIDKFVIRTASGITVLSKDFARKMAGFYQKPVEVIRNGFHLEEVNIGTATKNSRRILYYAGRFHNHRLPALRLFLEWLILDKNKDCLFLVRSIGPREVNNLILDFARKNNVEDRISLLEPADPETIFKEESEADALILFEDLEKQMPNSEGIIPGKLTEYLPFRAPVIAINREDAEIGEILTKTGRGYLVSTLQELDQATDKLFSGNIPKPNWDEVRKFSRKHQCEKLCAFFNQILQQKLKT